MSNPLPKLSKLLSGHVYELSEKALRNSTYNYFEIGVFNGLGFVVIAEKFPDRQCYAVDPFIEDGHTLDASRVKTGDRLSAQYASAMAHIADFPNASITVASSTDFYTNLTDGQINSMNIGVVLIDGNHNYDHVVNDYQLSAKLIGNKEGYVIFDDTDKPDVGRALNEFRDLYKDRIIGTDSHGSGVSIKLKAI
jgi:Methyltransferase domain